MTKNGELYYVNHVTKTTTWSRPQWTGSDGDDECEPDCDVRHSTLPSSRDAGRMVPVL